MSNESAYARAGVDIEAGERAVDLMKAHVAATRRPEVLGGLGGFAGFFDASVLGQYRHPCLLYTSPSPRDLSTSRMPSSA